MTKDEQIKELIEKRDRFQKLYETAVIEILRLQNQLNRSEYLRRKKK